jgi:hypothetical protein
VEAPDASPSVITSTVCSAMSAAAEAAAASLPMPTTPTPSTHADAGMRLEHDLRAAHAGVLRREPSGSHRRRHRDLRGDASGPASTVAASSTSIRPFVRIT